MKIKTIETRNLSSLLQIQSQRLIEEVKLDIQSKFLFPIQTPDPTGGKIVVHDSFIDHLFLKAYEVDHRTTI